MVTLREVARAAGVSPATASRALSTPDRVAADRLARVERAAAELGYRRVRREPDQTSPETRAGVPVGTLGLVVPDLLNPFFAGIARVVQQRARATGRVVVLADCEEDPHLEREILRDLAGRVEGLVLCSPRMSAEALAALSPAALPRPALSGTPRIVLVNRAAPGLPSVVADNVDGARQALGHLHALGHRRVAYAAGPGSSWSDRQRREGLGAAATDLDVDLVPLGPVAPDFTGGVAAADLVLAAGVSAVVCFNDLVALGVLDRLRRRGVSVPAEVSVVGFDDVPAATHVSPALTTVAVPLTRLGRAAVDLLVDEPESSGTAAPGTTTLPVSLVVRDSSGPAC